MYYEERMIGGWLWFKNSPDGDWQKCTAARYESYLTELRMTEEDARREAFDNGPFGAGA